MKKTLLIGLVLGGVVIVIVALLSMPLRFRLVSTSPSGKARVVGLRFQGRKPNALDGTLRLSVYCNQTETKHQTTVLWGRDIKIVWKKDSEPETFVVEKNGYPNLEFQIHATGIECIKGREYLAADPYR
jgi:hypothetical protein